MSLRPSPWVFGVGRSGRAAQALRQPAQAPRPELRVLEGGQQAQRALRLGRFRIAATATGVCVLLFAVVAFHVVLSQGQFQLERMENRAIEEQAQFERLRLQVAQLESPQRITEEAVNRLGMVPAEDVVAVAPRPGDISPIGAGELVVGDPTTESSRAKAWTEVKPHLSSASK